jgi:tetratricopeptide (TPR) repeat protein
VGALLEGSVRRDGPRLRISAKMVAVPDGRSLWSESYDRELGDVFALQEGIARSVVGALQVKLMARKGGVTEAQRTTPEAYLQHLLGYQLWVRGSPGDIPRSIEAFEKALAIDPGYAPAWAGLAWSLEVLAGSQPGVVEVLAMKRRALEAAERAVERGPGEARAYYARGGLRAYHRREWREALADLDRAMALRPSDAAVHRVHGWILEALGRLPEAIAALRRATDLEPLSARGWDLLARLHVAAGDHAGARAAYARIREVAPEHRAPQFGLAELALLEGRPTEALAALGSVADGAGRLWVEALVEHSTGRDAESRKALTRLTALHSATSAYEIGVVHAWRGETGEAFSWLERAAAQLDWGIMSLKTDPFLRPLHSDQRWKALLLKLNLPVE